LLDILDRFVDLQKGKSERAVEASKKIFGDSVFWISFFGVITFLISILISRYVAQAVAVKNQQLMDAREEMEVAFKKAEEATIIKSEFLATMSHEIRTPLTAIIGFAETSLFNEQTKKQRELSTRKIIRSGQHLLQIINDILDLSKIEANKLEIEHIELSLFELLADIENLVRPAAEEKGLGFSINYILPLPERIISDPLRVKQILINLCNNAIKFTEKGYVLINISSDDARAMSKLKFEVIDSGVGIARDKQESIFKAYQQADSSITRRFGGTGLGLSLSNKLAGFLGGELTVESEEDKGSKFIFSLAYEYVLGAKLVFDKEHLPKTYEMSDRVKSSGYLSGHVLLAEDNKDNQDLLLLYLNRMGIDVTVVDNGQLAVDAAAENNFDAVLMDMRMPVMGGLEAINILREKGFAVPIIALTANAMKEDKKACFDAGCNDFLSKPVDADALSETLEKYLTVSKTKENNEVLVSLLSEDGQRTLDLIKRYVGHLSNTLDGVDALIQEQDWSNLSDQLHQLKGTSGNYGYPSLALLAEVMEKHTSEKNKEELIKDFIELKNIHQKIIRGLDSTA
ncbi:MAG: response regulator, partial [Gammaproteobacteria bacterium]|nr:response regulator [Gammaproteobacteria bacterium]